MIEKTSYIDRIIQNRVVSHFIFWIMFFIIFSILAVLNSGNLKESILSYLAFLPSQLMAGYFLVYYQVPKLLLKKKYALFGISFLLSVYIFSIVARLSSIYFAEPFFREDFYQESLLEVMKDPLYLAIVYFPTVYVVVFLMLIIKVVKDRFEEKHQFEILQKEKANTELKFLKAQTNPHFLFNTLNNLYSLTLAKSDKAPEVVLKLSDMLDYMLYQCNEPTVSIIKEIELIQNYLDIESLRYNKTLNVNFKHSCNNIDAKIAPLVLLPFIENAFKHSAKGTKATPIIEIELNMTNNKLRFKVRNSKPTTVNISRSKGIGMENIKRQLELHYKNNHDLVIDDGHDYFDVELNIVLK